MSYEVDRIATSGCSIQHGLHSTRDRGDIAMSPSIHSISRSSDKRYETLTALRQELLRRIERLRADQRRAAGALSPDSSERAVERENDEAVDAILAAAETELALVKTALSRIESGIFESCASCGKPIGNARLKSIPYATQCERCAGSGASHG